MEKITGALGHTRTFTYTERGQVASVTDANGNTTSYQYDPLKRLITVTDAQGHKTSYDYDPVGNLTAVHQYRAILPETMAAIEADAATVTGMVYNQSVAENVYDNTPYNQSVTESVYGDTQATVNSFVYDQVRDNQL